MKIGVWEWAAPRQYLRGLGVDRDGCITDDAVPGS
jgi:hypothetical protein